MILLLLPTKEYMKQQQQYEVTVLMFGKQQQQHEEEELFCCRNCATFVRICNTGKSLACHPFQVHACCAADYIPANHQGRTKLHCCLDWFCPSRLQFHEVVIIIS